jgi:hypothetical protein
MRLRNDFLLWERELRESRGDEGEGLGRAIVMLTVPVGCAGVIALGETFLGIAAFVICVVILVLWRIGM